MSAKKEMHAAVRVPASTSNLGAGFDCVGVAVDRWLTTSVVASEQSGPARVMITRSGTVADLEESAEDDLVHAGFTLACAASYRSVPGRIDYTVSSTIPTARGLGSSAAALIAGAMLANEALSLGLDQEAIASLCSRSEGHPDNVGAAVFGGAVMGVASSRDSDKSHSFATLQVHGDLALVFAVPDLEISTSTARALLPSTLPYATTVAAIAKSAALVHGLATGDPDLLAYALDDVVHVPFRRSMIPGYDSVVSAAIDAGAYGATLSGSGSAIVAISAMDRSAGVGAAMQAAWRELSRPAEVIVGARSVAGASPTRA
jgi:homoserine kinase